MHSERLKIASGALAGLLAYHGAGYDPYHRREDEPHIVDETDAYVRQLLAKRFARHVENKTILAREAVAYADALLLELERAEACENEMVAELVGELGVPAANSVYEDDGQVD